MLVLEVEVWVEIRKNNNWTVGQAYTKKCSFWLSFCSVFVVGCVKFILALEYVIWTNVGLVKGSVLWNNSFVVWQVFIIPSFIFSGAGLISWWEAWIVIHIVTPLNFFVDLYRISHDIFLDRLLSLGYFKINFAQTWISKNSVLRARVRTHDPVLETSQPQSKKVNRTK